MTETAAPAKEDVLRKTPLDELHRELGARMVPFAGYDMPVQYPSGIIKEHQRTRTGATLFDVSHMGQAWLRHTDGVKAMESLVPADITGLSGGQMAYTLLTNETGGIIDDLMLTQCGGAVFVVVNAGRKDVDFAHIKAALASPEDIDILTDQALLALQGPLAEEVLARFIPAVRHMVFMTGAQLHINDIPCFVTRSGYTGEDGFEISLPAESADQVARLLLDEEEVAPAGLGARDSLRLEAGMCLYGSDIDETTTPVEAALSWTIAKRRRQEGGFPGAEIINKQITDGAPRRRVGLRLEGRAPARSGAEIVTPDGTAIGTVTSGGFAPSVEAPVAMGYVTTEHAAPGTDVHILVRGKPLPARVSKLPFIKRRYVK